MSQPMKYFVIAAAGFIAGFVANSVIGGLLDEYDTIDYPSYDHTH